MKELSIEEKAERFDEALAMAKECISYIPDDAVNKYMLNIFPELKESEESEDEKMRKGIIRNLEYLMDRAEGFVKDELKERIAWLEKQGNLMKALQISNAKIGELIEKNYCLKEQLEKQGEHDMGISEATKQKLEDNLTQALGKETPESCNKFLDEQGEQKPAWSEEDEKMIWAIPLVINTYPKQEMFYGYSKEKLISWIKSLKDRYTWKPSDEQMDALESAVSSLQSTALESLYQNLTKINNTYDT